MLGGAKRVGRIAACGCADAVRVPFPEHTPEFGIRKREARCGRVTAAFAFANHCPSFFSRIVIRISA